jgi:hypothetical protein
MTTFEERESAFEKRFALGEDRKFRVRLKRDWLIGDWAGKLMGLSASDCDAYAEAFTRAGIGKDDDALLDALRLRFEKAGLAFDEERARRKLVAAQGEAEAKVTRGR